MDDSMNSKQDKLSGIRAAIAASKHRAEKNGMIGYYGCLDVTDDLIELLGNAEVAIQEGDYLFAYRVASLIHSSLIRLALSADDSGGGVTEALGKAYPVIEQLCEKVPRDSKDATQIFLQSIKDCSNKLYEGMEEYALNLLSYTARLADPRNVMKLRDLLDEIKQRHRESTYYLSLDALVWLEAILATQGQEAADSYAKEHLHYKEIRERAVEWALERGDLKGAQDLILEYLESGKHNYWNVQDWYQQLFELYGQSGDTEQQEKLARSLLLVEHDPFYYHKLKDILITKGEWQDQYLSLLHEMSQELEVRSYLDLLAGEDETELMLQKLREFPEKIFFHAEQLAEVYPEETWQLMVQAIQYRAERANKRSHYRDVCRSIQYLTDLGGYTEAAELTTQLWKTFKGKPAFQEELVRLASNLGRKPRRR